MNRRRIWLGGASLLVLTGCPPMAEPPMTPPPVASAPAQRPSREAKGVEVSWQTPRDEKFAKFLRDKAGGMLVKAAVGLDKGGQLRVELDKSVAPEDTLDLTKSLLAGARSDFPDKPITLSVFDPTGSPILKAEYKPGEGVHYQVAHDPSGSTRVAPGPSSSPTPGESTARPGDPLARSGVTEDDRKFALWAVDHGKSYLRYVEADLEKHGRLWFGVTREVKPADVPKLTLSLLEGAQKAFPKRDLVATVFDPEGEKIGKAHLESGGQVRWEN